MLYEPIGYIYEIEIGALAVYLIIMLRYFLARRFPNQRNRLYALILWVTVADIVLDIASAIIIDNIFRAPLFVTYVINTAFYAVTVLMLILMMVYSYALTGHISKERFKRIAPLLLPGVVILLMLAVNPLTRWLFYVDSEQGYVHASLFWLIFGISFLYLIFTCVIVRRNRNAMRKEEYTTIILFLTVVFCSTLAQYLFPSLLLTGVAIVMAVVLMYFTIQNPESMVDMTTGAFTYEAMLTFLRDRLQERDPVQIVAIKICNMSRINDLLGIENGSRLLRQMFRFLSKDTKDTWIFRMRGSCYVAITRQRSDYDTIRSRLAQRIGEPWPVNGTEVLLHAVVCCVEPEGSLAGPISPEETVNYLETAVNEHERTEGRIVSITVGQELLDRIKRRNAIEVSLHNALVSGDGLELYFQPLWSVQEERFVSAEVLLRYCDPILGEISPDEFIAIAENCGFITALDEFVVRKACAFLHDHDDLRELGIENLQINLSALEFMHRRLPEMLRDIMTQYRIDPRFLCFEVTETAATESFELLRDCISEIMQLGCDFALDDFGTGYANIYQVIQLPFSTVKLDRSMLYGPPAVLEDLVRMFARIDRKTVVEGVETAAQAELITSYEVDIMQGFYLAKPMNGDDLLRFLSRKQGREASAERGGQTIGMRTRRIADDGARRTGFRCRRFLCVTVCALDFCNKIRYRTGIRAQGRKAVHPGASGGIRSVRRMKVGQP